MKIAISVGHGLHIRGASATDQGGLDEVNEAIRATDRIAEFLRAGDNEVHTFFDTTSTTQDANLKKIASWHNSIAIDDTWVNIFTHLNAYTWTTGMRGCEALYYSAEQLATELSAAMSRTLGLPNRGPHKRTDLYVLAKTIAPGALLECCFVDAAGDVTAWQDETKFEACCEAIAAVLAPDLSQPSVAYHPLVELTGKVSTFGGKNDLGVDADEPLAFIFDVDDTAGDIFYDEQPPNTTGLARRLNSEESFYVAVQWDYAVTPHDMLLSKQALVSAKGKSVRCWPADWGPASQTGRIADCSVATLRALGVETDDIVTVIFPAP
jgi:hypothetical protein